MAATRELSAAAILEGCEEELLAAADVRLAPSMATSQELPHDDSCESDRQCHEVISPDVSVHSPAPVDAPIEQEGFEMWSPAASFHSDNSRHAVQHDVHGEWAGQEQAFSTPKPQRRRAKSQPRLKSPAQTPMKTCQSKGSVQKQRSERSRCKSSSKVAPRRSPLQELNPPAARSRGSGGRSQRPAWDFTSSDMSRYKLSPAEHLRRQLLRISRHRDEAAVQFHQRLRSMQENLTPFLHESQQQSNADVSCSSIKSPTHMTPCFASRVPTGRIPQESKAARGSTQRLGLEFGGQGFAGRCGGAQHERSDNFMELSSHGQSLTSVQYAIEGIPRQHPVVSGSASKPKTAQHDRALNEEVRLAEALEAEIQNFFNSGGKTSDPRSSPPEYRFLRRKQQSQSSEVKATGHSSTSVLMDSQSSNSTRNVPTFRSAPINSDSELDELEADAGQLEAQLEWWRKHEKIVGNFGISSPSSLRGQDTELDGCSEWLRLSSASRGRSAPSASTSNVVKRLFQASPQTLDTSAASQHSDVAVAQVPSLPTFERSTLQDFEQENGSSRASTICADSSLHSQGNHAGSLSELVRRQARDLVDSTLSNSNLQLDVSLDSPREEIAQPGATFRSTSIYSVSPGSTIEDHCTEGPTRPPGRFQSKYETCFEQRPATDEASELMVNIGNTGNTDVTLDEEQVMHSSSPQLQFDQDTPEHLQDAEKLADVKSQSTTSTPECTLETTYAARAPELTGATLPCVRWQGADEADSLAVTVAPNVTALERPADPATAYRATSISAGAHTVVNFAPSSVVKAATSLVEHATFYSHPSLGADLQTAAHRHPAAAHSQNAGRGQKNTGAAKSNQEGKQLPQAGDAAATLALAREWAAEIASAAAPKGHVREEVQRRIPTETVGEAASIDPSFQAKEVPTRLEIHSFDELFNM